MNSNALKIGGAYALICLLWGSTWLVIKISLTALTPVFSAGIRFLIASIFIYFFMRIMKVKLQTDKKSVLLYLFMAYFSFVIPFGLVYWAEQFIESGLTSVLFAVMPFMVIIISRFALPGEKIGPFKFLGVVLGFTGIVIIFSKGISFNLSNDFWGMLAVFISATIQGGVSVVLKKHGGNLNALSMNFVPVLLAGITMVLFALAFENTSYLQLNWTAAWTVIYLAFFGTLMTFTTFYWLLKRVDVVILSLSTFITPIVAVFLGFIVLNERLTEQHLIGSSFVLIGILFANFRSLLKYLHRKKKFA